MVITKLVLPRRTFLRGVGATVALPFLDAMVPALKAQSSSKQRPSICGGLHWQWRQHGPSGRPNTDGVNFEMSPILKGIEEYRDRMAVFTDLDNFPATDQGDVGGQHPRAAPAFMSGTHAKATEGADLQAGTTIDQIIAAEICRDTKLPSLETTVDRIDVVGACDHGYACAYMNCMSWRTPTTPLPAETNPRFIFERMFGVGSTAGRAVCPCRGRSQHPRRDHGGNRRTSAAGSARDDRSKLGEYFDAVRDVEQRIVEGRVDQQRLLRAGSACRRARHVQGVYRAAVRPPGVGVPGRHHACRHHHDGAREHQSCLSGDWRRRCASLDLAPRQPPGEARDVMRRSTRITSRC